MRPALVVRIIREAFHDKVVCTGDQLGQLVAVVGRLRPALIWYAADVQAMGPWPEGRDSTPAHVGSSAVLTGRAAAVSQFESGVFVGVASDIAAPRFREGGLWTEDEDDADLGDAIIEIRAFDTTYWLIATVDEEIGRRLTEIYDSPVVS